MYTKQIKSKSKENHQKHFGKIIKKSHVKYTKENMQISSGPPLLVSVRLVNSSDAISSTMHWA